MSSGDSAFPDGNLKINSKKVTHHKGEILNCQNSDSKSSGLRLHKQPFLTLYYFIMEMVYLVMKFLEYVFSHKKIISIILFCGFSLFSIYLIDGIHQKIALKAFRKLQWWGWWILLGFLSSCGFGSGLHTFVLYLGPFIAKVTMAAYECGTTDFPEPPYPEQFVCPDDRILGNMRSLIVVKKIFIESMLWGLGTAIGELPPYFMARAAALNGSAECNQDIEETGWSERAQRAVKVIVKRVGFIGIVLCASVPNPLFDLAGMTCGHFLVPFSTFFGATVLGKAVNKMLIQMSFVVFLFSQDKVAWLQTSIKKVPRYGHFLNSMIEDFLSQQREKIHKSIIVENWSYLQYVFSSVQIIMLIGFLISIIHSFADNYAARMQKWRASYNQYLDNSKIKTH